MDIDINTVTSPPCHSRSIVNLPYKPHSLFDLREHCLHRTISISLLFRKGNVCTSKGFFEEEPCHPGPSRLGIPCPSRVCTPQAAACHSHSQGQLLQGRVWCRGRKNKHMKNTWGFWSRPSEVSSYTMYITSSGKLRNRWPGAVDNATAASKKKLFPKQDSLSEDPFLARKKWSPTQLLQVMANGMALIHERQRKSHTSNGS